ncbi:MAG: NAD(P)H-dependent oxidoreductase subunit E [Desulfitobacterium hafniense]|nr:NAD(P)H-dependent oxidoreductase subunit E [Desulfitobacterium hafniense]
MQRQSATIIEQPSEGLRGFEPEILERRTGNCCCDTPKEQDHLYFRLDDFIDSLSDQDGVLIRVLHHAQNIFGYLPREVQIHIANRLGKSLAEVYGVASFYHYFSLEPKAEFTVEVCMGTACYVKGAANIISELEKELGIKVGQITSDQRFGLKVSRCIGACGLAPVMVIGEDIHGRLTPEMIPEILQRYSKPKEG